MTAILLTIWAIICIFDILGPTVIMGFRPLIAGTGAGLIVGDLNLGMAIGATLELTALGVYTYGGATIPDYQTGAIIGTALAAVGFAMLLKIMPVGRYWYMLLIGFVLFAYLKVPLLGIALFGLAIAFLFETLRPRTAVGPSAPAAPAAASGEAM